MLVVAAWARTPPVLGTESLKVKLHRRSGTPKPREAAASGPRGFSVFSGGRRRRRLYWKWYHKRYRAEGTATMPILNITEVRKNLAKLVEAAVEDDDPTIIVRPGGKNAVIVSHEAYSSPTETLHVL